MGGRTLLVLSHELYLVDVVVFPHVLQELIQESRYLWGLRDHSPKDTESLLKQKLEVPIDQADVMQELLCLQQIFLIFPEYVNSIGIIGVDKLVIEGVVNGRDLELD